MTTDPEYPRDHDTLNRESTRDLIFLLQERRPVWSEHSTPGVEYDSESESLVDDDGRELTDAEAIDRGAGSWTWSTNTVFLTRAEGEDYAAAKSYRYPDGARVHCVPALGDLADAIEPDAELSPKYPRDHETLCKDCTRDPIYLVRERRAVWFGRPGALLTDEAIEQGMGVWTWSTVAVCLTRAEGDAVAAAMPCQPVRVYCVAAEGAICDVLARATIGGRYS